MIVGVLTTSFSRCNPMWFLSMGLRQGSGLCSSSCCKYPVTESMNHNSHWNHHRWHATNMERTRLSCWCLQNHKGFIYRAPVRYVTKTWSVVLLNKKKHIHLSQVFCVWQVVKIPTVISNNLYFNERPNSGRHSHNIQFQLAHLCYCVLSVPANVHSYRIFDTVSTTMLL